MHGLGILIKRRTVFEGNWTNGKINIFGRYFSVRNMFKGHYFMGQENGFGVYKSFDLGTIYVGDWKNGRHHGDGYFKSKDFKYEGKFRSHKKEG
jgi:hypothetical protein